jgi:hypothetical protein
MGFVVRHVNHNGSVSFRGHTSQVGSPLAGQPLGFKQTDEEEWEIYFGPLLIGYALLRKDGLRLEAVA